MTAEITPLRPNKAPEGAIEGAARLHAEAAAATRTAEDAAQSQLDGYIAMLLELVELPTTSAPRKDRYRRLAYYLTAERRSITMLRARAP